MPIDLPKDEAEQEYKDLVFDIKYDKEQFKDPMTIGLLLYRLSKERAKTNELFSDILKELKTINKNTSSYSPTAVATNPEVLADIDKEIIEHIKKVTLADAEEIRKHFGYKGTNAASARLNALFNQGLLKKKRAGKKVQYWADL